jgi:glycosyltransferase involved in cell wall biosynthesis
MNFDRTPQITVAIPSIPPRRKMLNEAIRSVVNQTLPAAAISVAVDVDRQGAPATRQRALDAVQTEWVAFLDDDDLFMNVHLGALYAHAMETDADFVYSWFWVPGGADPFPATHFTNPFDPNDPVETTITVLVRTELAKEVGFQAINRGHGQNTGEDRFFTLGCMQAGGKISHLVERTWYWRHHQGNTSGLTTKGDWLNE